LEIPNGKKSSVFTAKKWRTLQKTGCYWAEEYTCQGYVPLTLDVVRVAFKVPLALHTPL